MANVPHWWARGLLAVPEYPHGDGEQRDWLGQPGATAGAQDIVALLAAVGIRDTVIASVTGDGPRGKQRIVLTASGSDRVVDSISAPGSLNAVVVRRRDTVFETANAVLAAVAQWTGYTLGYKPVNNPGASRADGGQVIINIDHAEPCGPSLHASAPMALAAWVIGINALMADVKPQVIVSVAGQR